MPCMAPDLSYCERESQKAFEEILNMLYSKYDIMALDDPKFKHYFPAKIWLSQHVEAKAKLKEALKELFVIEGCASF